MITRVINFSVSQEKAAEAEQIWKQQCVPLMMKQPGCLNQQLMRKQGSPGEFISVSFWVNQQAIDKYIASDVRAEIRNYTLKSMGALNAEVANYDVLG